jgi:hypothetical protein
MYTNSMKVNPVFGFHFIFRSKINVEGIAKPLAEKSDGEN